MTMPKGPNRQLLDTYLDSAQEGQLRGSGRDWKRKAIALDTLAKAIKVGAEQAELKIGEQSLTGPALRKGMEETSVSMVSKSEQLLAAGEALVQVGTQIADTREARDLMKDLGAQPSPYQPPAGTPGVPLSIDDINAQAADSEARQGERTSWQDAFDKQEARARTMTVQMDSAFLGAIPPMKAIHGQDDPTEPPPSAPSGPGGPLLPGTQVPVTGSGGGGGGNNGNGSNNDTGRPTGVFGQPVPDDPRPDPKPEPRPDPEPKPRPDPVPTPDPTPRPDPIPRDPAPGPTPAPTTNVIGSSQTGVTYTPGGATVSAPVSASASPGMSTGAAMGAAGMAGGAGAAGMAGAVRGGSAPAAPGRSASAPVRAIGSTGRSGSASALSRSATPGSTAARPTAPGSASGTRAGAAGSAAGRGGAAGASGRSGAPGAAGRGGAPGAAGRGGAAGARGAGSAGAGSRAGGSRGAGGRSATGSAAGGSAAGGRGGRKGDGEQNTDRDSLVYDQDWLGDDEVAPGVLD